MARTAALCVGPAALLAWCWLRLGEPGGRASTVLWVTVLAIAPALLPRKPWRLLAFVPASLLALHAALGVWFVHPLRLLGRFGHGFLEFYDVRLPFASGAHPRMEGVVLLGLFASCALVALAVASRRPALASLAVLVGAGWPATLLIGPDDLSRGVLLLAVVLSLLVGVGERPRPRRVVFATVVGGAIVLAAFAASSSSAVASGQVLHWQGWDFYNKPQKSVGVEYVWNSDYRGLTFPKKVTTILKIKAPARRTYWRATTLDGFDGRNWFESLLPVGSVLGGENRDELVRDIEFPAAARNSRSWIKQVVTDEALRDNHLIGASVPVAYDPNGPRVTYAAGGVARLAESEISRGSTYAVWSYEPHPTPDQLARLKPAYPAVVQAADLVVAPGARVLPFGNPRRAHELAALFAGVPAAQPYRRVYEIAQRVVGDAPSPYAAAVELEAWFRTSGRFRYDEHPPQIVGVPPLAAFVLDTRRGYCQHFAGAMALMLRYLGIPARVAAGFTSGEYDAKTHEWTVTDHDAHTWVEAWFPRYGWLPFDPTPGRGSLSGSYTAASPKFDVTAALFAFAAKIRAHGGFDLRKARASRNIQPRRVHAARGGGGTGTRLGTLFELLLALGAAAVVSLAALKLARRRLRYLTGDPRRLARACLRELVDFVADQGAAVPRSATPRQLADVVRAELGPSAQAFASSASAARFGPPAAARVAAREAQRELKALRRELRSSLTRTERALGLLSLRSLGLSS